MHVYVYFIRSDTLHNKCIVSFQVEQRICQKSAALVFTEATLVYFLVKGKWYFHKTIQSSLNTLAFHEDASFPSLLR